MLAEAGLDLSNDTISTDAMLKHLRLTDWLSHCDVTVCRLPRMVYIMAVRQDGQRPQEVPPSPHVTFFFCG